jgi:chromosome partitioning protein
MVELVSAERRKWHLVDALSQVVGYDWVVLDYPPSLGLLTLNALCAAHSVIVPLQCEYLALEGLARLKGTTGA